MATDNEMRTLIALGAFSSVQGGGGDIPEDLTLNSLTACSVTAGRAYLHGPTYIASCTGDNAPVKVESVGGNLYADGYLVHTVGTRPLINGCLLRGGKYYYLKTDDASSFDFSGVSVATNETAEIWVITGCNAPQDFTLPSCWKWIESGCGCGAMCLQPSHFYDFAARNIKGVATVVNVAFDMPV